MSKKILKFKRRRKGLTNYYKRKVFVISGKTRLVVRKSNKYITVQFIKPAIKGDICLAGINSIILKKFGWPYSCKNLPACYLIGYIAGKIALQKKIENVALDIGLHSATKGSRIFAVVKGILDAGLKVPVDPEMLPSEERIKGYHIIKYAKLLKETNEENYKKRFSYYISQNILPENMEEYFNKTFSLIKERFG
ncbi:MAG: 50S ribosomal protein L18 [Thermoproteota archaeon]|jgi:large subunit ribosomal protein L18|nr:50S ribosomal protein L18 [Thermoproteota archaeon]